MITEEFVDALIKCLRLKKRAMEQYEEMQGEYPETEVIGRIMENEEAHWEKLRLLMCAAIHGLPSGAGQEDWQPGKKKKYSNDKAKKLKAKLKKVMEEYDMDCTP